MRNIGRQLRGPRGPDRLHFALCLALFIALFPGQGWIGPARGAVYLKLPAGNGSVMAASALTTEPPAIDETPLSPGEFVRPLDPRSLGQHGRASLLRPGA